MSKVHIYIDKDDTRDIRESIHRLLLITTSAVRLFDNRKEREQAYQVLSQWKWYLLPNNAIVGSGPSPLKVDWEEDWFVNIPEEREVILVEEDDDGFSILCQTKNSKFASQANKLHKLILEQFPALFSRYLTEADHIEINPASYRVESEYLTAVKGNCLQRLSADIATVRGRDIIRTNSDKNLSIAYYVDMYGYESEFRDEVIFHLHNNKTGNILVFPEVKVALPYFVVNAEKHVIINRFRDIYLPDFDGFAYSMFTDFISLL